MRLGWAVVAGALAAAALAWWSAREETHDPPARVAGDPAPASAAAAAAGPVLYRWHDGTGVVQITDTPPAGRSYTVVDVAALERRNIIDPDPAIEAAR